MATQYPFLQNPYQAAPPAYRLYDAGGVGLATFFGSPLAGAILIAANYSRLGKSNNGVLAVALGAIATALLVCVGFSQSSGASILGIVCFVATMQIARWLQGAAVAEHVAHGGALESKWKAFWIGVVTLAVLFAAIVAVIMYQQNGATVTIGTKDQVQYSGQATKDQATALGNALKTDGYFQDRGVTVLLNKTSSSTTISYVVQDGVWNQADMVSGFETVTRAVASTVGGLPIDMQLMNSAETVEKDEIVTAQAGTGAGSLVSH
jgi:hypothetical protein